MDLFKALPKTYPDVPNPRAEVMNRLRTAASHRGRDSCCFILPARVDAALALHREGEIRCWTEEHNGRPPLVCRLPDRTPPAPAPWRVA
jgi:hypothetical protein